jgi:hypothetical protein
VNFAQTGLEEHPVIHRGIRVLEYLENMSEFMLQNTLQSNRT